MKVQELFQQANKNDVMDAYLFLYGWNPNELEAQTFSIKRNVSLMRKERKLLGTLIEDICHTEADSTLMPRTLFVIPQLSLDYTERHRILMHTFYVHDEAEQMVKNPLWNQETENRIDIYGYDFEPLPHIVGMKIADTCRNGRMKVSLLDMTSAILREISRFGYNSQKRQEHIEEILGELQTSIRELEEQDNEFPVSGTPAEDVFAKLHNDFLENCQTEEERMYYRLKHEYKEKIREIEWNYEKTVIEENHELLLRYLKTEFS